MIVSAKIPVSTIQKILGLGLNLIVFILFSSFLSKPLKAQTEVKQIKNSNSLSNYLLAQSLPPKIPQPQDLQPPSPNPFPVPQLPQLLPPPIELIPPNGTSPQEQLPDNANQKILVDKFEVIGSTVFSPKELAKVTAKFTKRLITLGELFQARSAITDLYVSHGYITSGAYIPPQTMQSGTIKIQVIEGMLEDIQIVGNKRLRSKYVRSRLAIATNAPLNRDRLLAALRLLQLNPLIKNVSAELSAGSRPGTNVLLVKITEANPFHTQVTLDNGSSPTIGSFRRRLNISEGNLSGRGDNFSVTYTNSDGSNSVDTSYTLPLNPHNGTLVLSFSDTASNVIEPPFDILDIRSSSRSYEVTYRQPIIQFPTKEFALGLTVSRRETEADYISGVNIPFPALGADAQGRTRLTALRFFQEWTTRNSREVIALRSQFSQGIDLFNPTYNQSPPDNRFSAWLLSGQWARLLAPDTLFLFRLNTQLAFNSILPLEQFGVGGIDSVRGYRQDFLLGDNGTFVSGELHLPIFRLPKVNGIFQFIPFVDFGIGWNNSSQNLLQNNTLASAGMGWQWTQNNFTARFDWGVPLISVDSRDRTWQENGLYFSLQYNPF
jgi:hemolysin activation/secretion protein